MHLLLTSRWSKRKKHSLYVWLQAAIHLMTTPSSKNAKYCQYCGLPVIRQNHEHTENHHDHPSTLIMTAVGTLSILHLRDLWSARIRRKNMGCCYSVVRPSLSNHLMSIRFLPVWSVSKRPSKHESSMRFCPHLYRHLTWKAHPARQREPGIMRP